MPHKEDSAGVLGWVGKAPVDVLHEDIHFIRAQRLYGFLHIRGTESC